VVRNKGYLVDFLTVRPRIATEPPRIATPSRQINDGNALDLCECLKISLEIICRMGRIIASEAIKPSPNRRNHAKTIRHYRRNLGRCCIRDVMRRHVCNRSPASRCTGASVAPAGHNETQGAEPQVGLKTGTASRTSDHNI
jgi:hypothetical protein